MDNNRVFMKDIRIVARQRPSAPVEYHTNCHDCGQFVNKSERVAKDNPHKHYALCGECLSNYDDPDCPDNTM